MWNPRTWKKQDYKAFANHEMINENDQKLSETNTNNNNNYYSTELIKNDSNLNIGPSKPHLQNNNDSKILDSNFSLVKKSENNGNATKVVDGNIEFDIIYGREGLTRGNVDDGVKKFYSNNINHNSKSHLSLDDGIEVSSNRGKFVQNWLKPTFSECLATMVLVYFGTLQSTSGLGLAGVALTHGLIVIVLVALFGNISGAHMNPMVTLGIALNGAIKIKKAFFYILAQLIGSILASGLFFISTNAKIYEENLGGMVTFDTQKQMLGGVITCEVFLTTTFLLLILALVLQDKNDGSSDHISNSYAGPGVPSYIVPFLVGLTVIAAVIAGGTVSGAAMNPARVLGPSFVYIMIKGRDHYHHMNTQYVYYIAELIGCFIAVLLYKFVLKPPKRKRSTTY
ncbi:uncharacterized protein LOC135926303 isoform X1 [Gordionus sp. m RMFG-2023]|uniref:uncharacterized protein LOC135926303 isoform X1 n=1 Tax=Gordionus sp. m RMFG-2023 TaxID=3053472 RepID=UPI0031FD3EE7